MSNVRVEKPSRYAVGSVNEGDIAALPNTAARLSVTFGDNAGRPDERPALHMALSRLVDDLVNALFNPKKD